MKPSNTQAILSRIKTGAPLTVTNKKRLCIWIDEAIEAARKEERATFQRPFIESHKWKVYVAL